MTEQQFRRNRDFFAGLRHDQRRTMLTGKVQDDGSVTMQGAPTNKTWVRDTIDSRRSVPAWGVIPTANVPVIVDVNTENELEIVGVNWIIGTPMWSAALQGVSAPPIQGDVQALNVSAQNIAVGRLQPSGAGGLNVQATGFHFPAGFWRGGALDASAQGGLDQTVNDLDLASNVPGSADQVRWVRVYYDPSTGALAAANGTAAVQAVADLDEDDIKDIAIPAGAYPVGAVALSYGQTDFNTASQVRFVPARYLLSPEGYLLTGDAATRTIASGVITVGVESSVVAAAQTGTTDDLDTLTVNTPRMGWIVADTGDTITLKHGTGNISCFGGADIDITDASAAVWMYDGTTVFVAGGGGGGAFTDLSDTFTYSGNGDKAVFVNAGETALEPRDAMPIAAKTRYVATKLYDSTLGSAGRFDVPNASLSGGNYADYDRIVGYLTNVRGTPSATNDFLYIFLNGDTTAANYGDERMQAVNTSMAPFRDDAPNLARITAASSPSNYVTDVIFEIENPGGSNYKNILARSQVRRDATNHDANLYGIQWENTAAITQITIQPDGYSTDNIAAGARLVLIGWKEEAIGGIAYSTADVSNPPTDAELDSAFGTPASLPVPFAAVVNDNDADTAMYLVVSNGTSWWYGALTKAT